jgi:hypothetical protein
MGSRRGGESAPRAGQESLYWEALPEGSERSANSIDPDVAVATFLLEADVENGSNGTAAESTS